MAGIQEQAQKEWINSKGQKKVTDTEEEEEKMKKNFKKFYYPYFCSKYKNEFFIQILPKCKTQMQLLGNFFEKFVLKSVKICDIGHNILDFCVIL